MRFAFGYVGRLIGPSFCGNIGLEGKNKFSSIFVIFHIVTTFRKQNQTIMTNSSKNALFTPQSVGNFINVVLAVVGALTIGYMVYVQLSGHHF